MKMMSMLVNKDTKVIVQGITGSTAQFHTEQMLEYGTKIVAGVTPGKGGNEVEGVPVFNTIEDAVAKTGATFSDIYLLALFAPAVDLDSICSETHCVWRDGVNIMLYYL